jgi:hypothetical protein
MVNKLKKGIFFVLVAFCPFFSSCDEDVINTIIDVALEFLDMLGYNTEDEVVEDQNTSDEITDVVTDTKVDWEQYCPPIGNQGSYGTCVAWATAYNLKTTLNMIDGTWKVANKNSAMYQCSPVDLWHLMPTDSKSSNCGGSNFEPAFEVMISKGVASMSDVPFTNSKMVCDYVNGKGSSSNKLAEYRIVAYSSELTVDGSSHGMNENNIKNYLKMGPLVVGAKLGDRFMAWNSSDVISYDTKTYQGQHAYHAMALVGFDDSKGAFRLRNSWGADDWGDNGSIWVDYDFFFDQFCFGVWRASNSVTSAASTKSSSGNDVKVTVISDNFVENGKRLLKFSIANNGSSTISTANYPIAYLLFKAKHLTDKYLLIDNLEEKSIAPGQNATFEVSYSIPQNAKEGKYYLALIADPYNEVGDNNQADNFSFVTGNNMEPFYLSNGILSAVPSSIQEVRTLVCERFKNAYRNDEIKTSLIRMKKNKSNF